MRRRSDRGKTKATPKEESPEKATRKSHRHSRRRRKSSSSSDSESKSPKKDSPLEIVSQPLEVQVQDIELPQGEIPGLGNTNNKSEETPKKPDEPEKPSEWKEDNAFWESDVTKPTQEPSADASAKEKEENSLWKVQSANGAGGEIQKLKICRQRPTGSPEIGEASLRKRLSRGPRDSRSTDDSTHEESEKDTKISKHRTRTSSKNSPLVSPTVVCDMSEDSPTKIKIINVSHINTEVKGGNIAKTVDDETVIDDNRELKTDQNKEVKEDSQINCSLDIALPTGKPSPQTVPDVVEVIGEKIDEPVSGDTTASNIDASKTSGETSKVEESSTVLSKLPESLIKEENTTMSPVKPVSPSPSTKEDELKSDSSRSTGDSDSSEDKSKPRKVKKKRRRDLQSSVQRRLSTSASPIHESSDSEDDNRMKREVGRRESSDVLEIKDAVNDKEYEADNALSSKENNIRISEEKEEPIRHPMPRKRRWGSSKSNRPNKKPILNISTISLKSLVPDAKPVPAEELQLSFEEEEGQLDDDEEEDDVVALVGKEEEIQWEHEKQVEERQKERDKELSERHKKKEHLNKHKPEQPPASDTSDKGAASRKILLLSDSVKTLPPSPSPPRHKPTSVLYITHLVRPFTVQQLKNLLLRTGTIAENGFWIDKIKSKCYVQYSTEDAAIETRHALHGVRWPTSNPKTLVVEFASPNDLALALLSDEPEVPRKMEPLTMVEGWVAEQARIKERTRRTIVREWDVGKPEYPDEALEHDIKMKEKKEHERKTRKERPHRSATPETEPPARKPRRKEEDAPAKLLDDLFRKTKTSPCIYWLPLTQEQIAVKEEIRRQHMAEHERRMAELKKADQARRDRERRNRK